MKRRQQVLAYVVLIVVVTVCMFITAFVNKQHSLTLFGWILVIGNLVIIFSGKRTSIIRNDYKTSTNPTENVGNVIVTYWNKFLTWLNT